MRLIYNIGISFYAGIIQLASWWNPKAKKAVEGRKNLWEILPNISNEEVVWFHCASLGEYDQATPLIELVKSKKPDLFVLVTFFSPSGFDNYKKRNVNIDFACYLPFDKRKNAERFINHFKPTIVFFVKYEFWSNFIFTLKKHEIKIYSISTILRPNHRFFKPWGGFFRKTLNQFDHFFVQNSESKDLLASIGINRSTITGDNRYDKVISNLKHLSPNKTLEAFVNNSKLTLIVGSCWPQDERQLLPVISELPFEKVIIAPHNIDKGSIHNIENNLKENFVRYTAFKDSDRNKRILILDTIGHLSGAYHYGHLAYVGGGYSGNLHNILEPAVFGLPVVFGPKHTKFPEAQLFIDNGFAFSSSSSEEIKNAFTNIIENQEEFSTAAKQLVANNTGASELIYNAVFSAN